jgi:tetratricopeptide (TPR) repeat protein
MVEIPPSLLERLKVRQTVLVAGLRCSELAGAPGWEELGRRLCDCLADEARRVELAALIDSGRRAAAFGYLGARVAREAVLEVLKEAYPVRSPVPAVIAAAAEIPWRGVITTGFDGLWAGEAVAARPSFSALEARELGTHAGSFVLNLCGTTAAPESLSLGAASYRAQLAPTPIFAFLRELGRRRSLVFVGFAPGDPDLTLVTQALAGAAGSGPHFLLADAAGLEGELLGTELGVTVVPCPPGREGVEQALRALGDAWSSVAAEARPADDDVAAWFAIWRRDPADEEPRAALARAETALRAERRWDDVVELLLGRVELEEARAAQVATLREVARLYADELGAAERAFAALEAAFRRDPSSEGLRADVERAAGKAGLWGELAADYVELADEVAAAPGEGGQGDGAAAVPHRLALARVYAEELDRLSDAIAEYEAVLALDEKNQVATLALVDLLARAERWPELAVILARAAAEADGARAVELRLQLADVQAARLGDVGAAIATYERVLADDADSGEALSAVEKLTRRAERWSDLARILDEKARRVSDPALAARLRRERAELLAERLGDADASIRELEIVLAADPDSRAALRALEKLYEKQGRDVDYLRTVERLADLAESNAERLPLLRRLAAEWEERRGPEGGDDVGAGGDGGAKGSGLDRAADALEQIVQIAPDDADAFRALARVYRQSKRFLALAEALARRRDTCGVRAESRALSAQLARLYEDELRDPVRAFEAYAEAEALGDESEGTLAAVARLHEQAGRWAAAAETLERLSRVARETPARVDALVRAAAIALERLDDRETAETRYARALELDGTNLAALGALATLYRRQGDLLRAAKLMREAEAHTNNRIDKARLLYELGALYQDELGDEGQATEVLGRVLDVDPEHVPAAERLVTLHERAERWAVLEPVLEMLARKIDRANGDDGAVSAALLQARLGETARRLGNLDKALRAYEAAHELAPDASPVLRGLAALREQRGEWREAAALYGVASERADALPVAERVDLFTRLGRCEAEAGERAAALAAYDKVLALEPQNRPAAEAVARLHADQGDFGALIADKRALLALASDDETRVRLSEEIGDLCADKLADVEGAIAAYRAVLAMAPTRRQTLHKVLELYTAGQQWPEAAESLERLAALEGASAVRAKYLYAAAVIRRDELDDPAGAVALLNRALDDAPDLTKAFDAIERVLADVGAWRELARNYRRMIKRLPAEGLSDLRLRLWSGLGEVSVTQLEDMEMAATALEVATSLDPDNVQRHEQLADVYVAAGPTHQEKAIAEHQWLVAHDADRLGSYRALAKLYGDVHAYDKLWCVAATLSFLRKADPELQAFYETHRPREFRAAKRAFNDETWLRVVHPDEDRFIDAIFMLLGQFVAAAAAQQHQVVGLRRKERVDVAVDQRVPTRILRYVAETLELATPDLFFKESEPQSLAFFNLQEKGVLTPALVIGKGIEQRGSELELVFEMAKRMAFLRPERYVRSAVPSVPALDVALRAALALGGVPIGNGAHNGEVDQLTSDLRRLVPKPVTDQLAAVGRKLFSARGDVIDVQGWMGAADLTAARVGFALTNDLAAAARVISTEPVAGSPVSPKHRLKDLLAYSVSEDYFTVRKFLGLEVM